jgi:hypothetical protein
MISVTQVERRKIGSHSVILFRHYRIARLDLAPRNDIIIRDVLMTLPTSFLPTRFAFASRPAQQKSPTVIRLACNRAFNQSDQNKFPKIRSPLRADVSLPQFLMVNYSNVSMLKQVTHTPGSFTHRHDTAVCSEWSLAEYSVMMNLICCPFANV